MFMKEQSSVQKIKFKPRHNKQEKLEKQSLSQIFLQFLEELMSEQSLHKYYQQEEFQFIMKYIEKYDSQAFSSLVDMSKGYLHKSIQSILSQFNKYYQNERYHLH